MDTRGKSVLAVGKALANNGRPTMSMEGCCVAKPNRRWSLSIQSVDWENPVAHQTAASTFDKAFLTCFSLAKSHSTICSLDGGLGPQIFLAFSLDRTKATTDSMSRSSNSWTTYFPTRPVAPVTATLLTTWFVGIASVDSASLAFAEAAWKVGERVIEEGVEKPNADDGNPSSHAAANKED